MLDGWAALELAAEFGNKLDAVIDEYKRRGLDAERIIYELQVTIEILELDD